MIAVLLAAWALVLLCGGFIAACGGLNAALRMQLPRPRVSVVKAEGGEYSYRANSAMRRGMVLAMAEHSGGTSIQHSDGTRLIVNGRSELVYLGVAANGPRYRLRHGALFGKQPCGGTMTVESDLGSVDARGAVFNLTVTQAQAGVASDTPRVLRLKVAAGVVRLRSAIKSESAVSVRSGVEAEIRETVRRTLLGNILGRQDWQVLAGHVPDFAVYSPNVGELPDGVWVRREPGRHGPTPGSHAGLRVTFSTGLWGGVLASCGKTWLYCASRDAWMNIPQLDTPLPTTVSNMPPVGLPKDAQGAVVAYDSSSATWLAFGGADTWLFRNGCSEWVLHESPNNPPPRTGHVLYFDPLAELFVLAGGEACGREYDDVWVFRAPGNCP